MICHYCEKTLVKETQVLISIPNGGINGRIMHAHYHCVKRREKYCLEHNTFFPCLECVQEKRREQPLAAQT